MGLVNNFWRYLSFLLLLNLMVFTVPSAVYAQADYKPSVPKFTIKLVEYSIDIPPSTTTTVNVYTGEKTTTTIPGSHIETARIDVTIKRQSFKSYTDEKNHKNYTYNLYYSVEFKPHFGGSWDTFGGGVWVNQVKSDTVVMGGSLAGLGYPDGAQLDFRVRALIIGYSDTTPSGTDQDVVSHTDWSSVQTITLSGLSFSVTTTWPSSPVFPTSSVDPDLSTSEPYNPPQQQSPWATYMLTVVATICIITIPIAIVMYHSRHQQQHQTRKSKGHLFNSSNVQFTKVAK